MMDRNSDDIAKLIRTSKQAVAAWPGRLDPIEAEELWQSAKVHFCDAVRDHAEKSKAEINGGLERS